MLAVNKRRVFWSTLWLVLILLIEGCQPKAAPDTSPVDSGVQKPIKITPTDISSPPILQTTAPAAVIPTGEPNLPAATESTVPTISIEVAATAEQANPQPTASPTIRLYRLPTPTPQPQMAHMRITEPGPYSKISSPLQVEALISPGDDGMVHVDLIGENGRTIASQLLDFRTVDAKNFFITPQIPFQINSAGELARLVISTFDVFGQMVGLISVDVLLIQMGSSDITAPQVDYEPYLVYTPREGSLISKGSLTVNGAVRPVNANPLILQLIDEQGNVVGSSEVPVSQPSDATPHVPFQSTISYTVDHRVRARLTLSQASAGRIPGTVWLSSSILFLDP